MKENKIYSQKDLKSFYENLGELADIVNDMIAIVNDSFKIVYINEKTHQVKMGYTSEDLIGINAAKLVHPDDLENVIEQFKIALETGEGFVEARIKNKKGRYVWTETKGKVLIKQEDCTRIVMITRDITERKNAEQKSLISAEKYKSLADSLPEVIFEIDLNFNLTYTNEVASKIFGYSHNDFLKGLTAYDFMHPEEKDMVISGIKDIFKGEIVSPFILRLRKKDGSYFYADIIAFPIYKDNEIVGLRSIIHDITEMKAAEKKIIESEEKFRIIAEQSLMGICIIQDMKVIYINNVLADLFGYSVEEVLGWSPGEFFKTIHPGDKKRIILGVANNEIGMQSYEARGVDKEGNIIWFDIYYKIIDYQNKPSFLITFVDISEKKKAEEKLKESEEKYRFLFEKSPIAILLSDSKGMIIDCNPKLESLFGYDRKYLIGKKYLDLPPVAKEDVPLLAKRLKKIAMGENVGLIELKLYKKDGSEIWASFESSIIKSEDKTFIMIMGHDISEKKEAEQKLMEIDNLRKEFIDRASHELKTPITTVYGAYQLLNTVYKDKFSLDQLEILELAFNGTKRLKRLVDDLLDVSKLESKMLKLEKEEVNFSDILKNCVKEMKYLSNRRHQSIILEIPDKLLIKLDKTRIEVVLNNLLSNAIKYTPIDGTIFINLEKINNSALLKLRDTGIGLSPNEIKKLFKKFSKIESSIDKELGLDIPRTGLGLYISKEIITLHKGQIWVESGGKGKGSTFYIKLPFN